MREVAPAYLNRQGLTFLRPMNPAENMAEAEVLALLMAGPSSALMRVVGGCVLYSHVVCI